MPITPDQAHEKRLKDSVKEFNRCCEEIDEMLSEGGRAYSTAGMTSFVIERVCTEYARHGWDVQLVADWRDGNFLQFKG